LFVDLFLEAHQQPPKQIILDLDATDDPLHGHQEGRFFHGYYDCYCYLPLYIFCGWRLLAAKQRPANIDAAAGAVEEVARIVAQIRAGWPEVRIVLRADSGFAREALMRWCELNSVEFLFGLVKNERLVGEIAAELAAAEEESQASGQPARRFKDFAWSLLCALRRLALQRTLFAKATCGTIRLKLLKIGALVRTSVWRISFAMASGYPYQRDFARAHAQLTNTAAR
jgi:Transposase DDE domain group 1